MAFDSFYKQNTLPELTALDDTSILPDRIGPYKIEALLNKGGMSLLYLGIDPKTKEPLAIKVLSPTYIHHPEAIARFLQEAKVIALSNHPNIVKLYGQGEWEKGLYMAMQLIRGISLKQFIMQHSLSLRRAIEIILQVAHALSHLHSHGVIHRDLKPENILITEDGEVKVIDFGIAQLHNDRNHTSSLSRYLGTPNYMSPEQKQDPTQVTFATDIYSLGIILYELVSGKLSYGTIHLLSLPKGLKKIAEKCLAISVSQRYQNISEFIRDISHYLESKEISKERSGNDQVRELHEKIQRKSSCFSPSTLPSWPQIELGVGKERGIGQVGLYYDFFRLPNNTFLILMATPQSSSVDSALSIGVLRGMVRMYLSAFSPSHTKPFEMMPFLERLNDMVFEDCMKEHFTLSCVLLDPLNDNLSFISCGGGPLIYIPKETNTPRLLSSQNPQLGAYLSAEFSATNDNWNVGDALLLHTFVPSSQEKEPFDQALYEAAKDTLLFSAENQAEGAFKSLSALPSSFPKALIAIQRII